MATHEPSGTARQVLHKIRWVFAGRLKRVIWPGAILSVLFAIGFYWTYHVLYPEEYDIIEAALRETETTNPRDLRAGSLTTTVLIRNMGALLEAPGGYLENDVMPPGIFMDNVPHWEFGVVIASRDLATAVRNQFSRAQSQSSEDADLELGEPLYYFETDSWILPPTEWEYRKGMGYFRSYLKRLQTGEAAFYPRADNLSQYIDILAKRLGSYTQRLSVATHVQQQKKLADALPVTEKSPPSSQPLEKPSWFELDDRFYEARGYCWALLHIMRAIQGDFAGIIDRKAAAAPVAQIIRELEATQAPLLIPIILNGNDYGLFSNHLLTLANDIGHANAALIDLKELLEI
ncbi:MAG: DUF2333 family protein [Methylohalobius crimeensis]